MSSRSVAGAPLQTGLHVQRLPQRLHRLQPWDPAQHQAIHGVGIGSQKTAVVGLVAAQLPKRQAPQPSRNRRPHRVLLHDLEDQAQPSQSRYGQVKVDLPRGCPAVVAHLVEKQPCPLQGSELSPLVGFDEQPHLPFPGHLSAALDHHRLPLRGRQDLHALPHAGGQQIQQAIDLSLVENVVVVAVVLRVHAGPTPELNPIA
jgi:hypothetical protein